LYAFFRRKVHWTCGELLRPLMATGRATSRPTQKPLEWPNIGPRRLPLRRSRPTGRRRRGNGQQRPSQHAAMTVPVPEENARARRRPARSGQWIEAPLGNVERGAGFRSSAALGPRRKLRTPKTHWTVSLGAAMPPELGTHAPTPLVTGSPKAVWIGLDESSAGQPPASASRLAVFHAPARRPVGLSSPMRFSDKRDD
jgi:hypothetical protein